VLVNGAMVSGLLPVVGVPMPLLSRGGTSSIILLASFGVVMALGARRTINR
jgi:rod shape determining protein RodA